MNDQLILSDETLRVIASILPYSTITDEVCRARDRMNAGHISTSDVREILRAMTLANADSGAQLVTRSALRIAGGELRAALRRVNLDALELAGHHHVSVFVLDPSRDSVAAIAAANAPL